MCMSSSVCIPRSNGRSRLSVPGYAREARVLSLSKWVFLV